MKGNSCIKEVHCFHIFRGPIHMVVPDGHVVVKCCHCKTMSVVHVDHLYQKKGTSPWNEKYFTNIAPEPIHFEKGGK